MNIKKIREACLSLGLEEPISIELDGTVWLGDDSDRTYPDMDEITAEVVRLEQQKADDRESGRQKLSALGLTQDEINALLGM